MRVSAAEDSTKTAQELTNQAKAVMGLIKEQEAALAEREAMWWRDRPTVAEPT
jgi:hypothetical protein